LHVNAAIYYSIENNHSDGVSGDLRGELMNWRFIDDWSGCSMWRPEFHKQIEMSNASSAYRFGTMVKLEEVKIVLDDYWSDSNARPFHVKEADAILKCLLSDYSVVKNAL